MALSRRCLLDYLANPHPTHTDEAGRAMTEAGAKPARSVEADGSFATNDSLVREAYDRVANRYDSEYTSRMYQAENVALRTILRNLDLPDLGTILDLGCGTGLLVDLLPEIKDRVIGLDISQNMLDVAKEKHPDLETHRGNMANLSAFPQDAFGAVTSLFGPISFCSDYRRCAEEIHRVLRPGGRFFIMACGTRYAARRSYQQQGYRLPMTYFRAGALRNLFAWAEDVYTGGFNVTVEDHCQDWPVDQQVQQLLAEYLLPQQADSGYQVVVTGTKP